MGSGSEVGWQRHGLVRHGLRSVVTGPGLLEDWADPLCRFICSRQAESETYYALYVVVRQN